MAQCVVCSTEIRDDARFCPSCGAEQPRVETAGTSDDPLMGKVVARKFKVEKLLGVGGMGKVYKARQLSLDKAVVVKVLHDQFREDPQLVQRFQREAKAASRLNHPNSIQIIDFGQDEGGVVFMAMEFLQGQDLFALLKKEGPLPQGRLAKIMIQACSALAEAHEQNVIHRDLKPENIMVEDRRGQRDFVKVLDFGIAKIQDPGEGQQALTQAGMVCGTPEYMSPEQARGLALDPRSDIYALGVVMYQLAVGELPFVADTPIGIVTKHILEKPVPPRQKRADVSPELEGIILKAMEKEPDKRFANVSELAEALEQIAGPVVSAFGGPRTNSGESSGAVRPAPGVGTGPSPVAPGPGGSGGSATAASVPTTTKPTPTGQSGAVNTAQLPANDANALTGPTGGTGGGGIKIAAITFGAVVVLALAALAVVKLVIKPGEGGVVDAGVVVAAADAGLRVVVPVVVDAGVKTPPIDRPAADAGQAVAALIVDAGTKVKPAAVDAGTKIVREKHDAGVKVKDPNVPSGGRAGAEKVFREAHAKFVADDCNGAMPGLGKAAQMDPTYGEPLRDIAMCQKKVGEKDRACGAAKEFVKRKKMTGENADRTLAVFCN